MLLACPHAGCKPLLRSVTCFHSPIGPAQISGGALNEWRMMAEDFAPAETEMFGPQKPAETVSLPRQRVRTAEFAGSIDAMAESPSTNSAKRILASLVQA